MKPLQDLGVTTIALQSTDGTDHLPFDWIGIPGFQFVQDPLDYIPQLHHTNQDIYDHCIFEDLVQSPIVMASFVYHAAMREEMLPRKRWRSRWRSDRLLRAHTRRSRRVLHLRMSLDISTITKHQCLLSSTLPELVICRTSTDF
jgi:hypothetical protein